MIAPNESKQLRILSFGLEPQEDHWLQRYAQAIHGTLEKAEDDMDLWGKAQKGDFEVCVLGQCSEVPDPSYLIWLLKGVANHSRIIMIYSQVPEDEARRLQRLHASHILQRPVEAKSFAKAIEAAVHRGGEKKESIWSTLGHLFSRKSQKV